MKSITTLVALVAVMAAGCATAPPTTMVRYYPTEGKVESAPRFQVGASFTIVNATEGNLAVIHDGQRKGNLKPGQSFGFEMSHNRYGAVETTVTVVGRKRNRHVAVSRKFLVGCQDGWLGGRDCRWRSYSWNVSRWSLLLAEDASPGDEEILRLFATEDASTEEKT